MSAPEYREIPLALINEPEAAIRSAMDPVKLDDLAASIRVTGQIHPLSVYPDGERFTIAAGHRRFVALSILADRPARCLVYPSSFDAMLEVQIAENVFHEDMKPTDEAIFFARLLEGLQIDTTALAGKLRMTRNYIEGRLALLAGDETIFAAVGAEKISLGVAHALNECRDDKQRRMLLDMAIHREATVRTVDGWVAEMNAMGVLTERAAALDAAGGATPVDDTPAYAITCDVCGDDDEPWTMVMVWMHTRCKKMRDRLLQQKLHDQMVHRE